MPFSFINQKRCSWKTMCSVPKGRSCHKTWLGGNSYPASRGNIADRDTLRKHNRKIKEKRKYKESRGGYVQACPH